jgi:hypothetical protein
MESEKDNKTSDKNSHKTKGILTINKVILIAASVGLIFSILFFHSWYQIH